MITLGSARMILSLWFVCITFCAAEIYQSSEVGENATMKFQMEESGGQSQCGPLIASGDVTTINTVLVFDPGNTTYSDARDMFILVRNGSLCVQYGGWNYEENECKQGGRWPNNWESSEAAVYNATADLTAFGLSGYDWEICVGNGYIDARERDTPSYEGSLDFTSSLLTTGLPPSMAPSGIPSAAPSISPAPTAKPMFSPSAAPTVSLPPTSAPSNIPTSLPTVTHMPTINSFIVTSDCNEIVDMNFDTELAGTQKSCSEFPASNGLTAVKITLDFSGATGDEYASDFLLIIINASKTGGIQIGGFNSYLDGLQYVGQWPSSWSTSDSGQYSAIVNVSDFNIAGEGYYTICIANGYANGDEVSYSGNVELPELIYRCDLDRPTRTPSGEPTSAPIALPTAIPTVPPTAFPTVLPTVSPTAMPTASPTGLPTLTPTIATAEISSNSTLGSLSSISFDAHLSGDQYICVDIYASGALVNVSFVTYFSSSNANAQASDMLLTIVAPVADRCIVVGGHVTSLVCPTPVLSYSWSSALDSSESGDYMDEVSVLTSALGGDGFWEMCISNGYSDESVDTAYFAGEMEFLGIVNSIPPDPSPSNSNDDNEDDDGDLALTVALPIVSVALIAAGVAACWYTNKRRRKEIDMTSPFISDTSSRVTSGDSAKQKKDLDRGIAAYVPPTVGDFGL